MRKIIIRSLLFLTTVLLLLIIIIAAEFTFFRGRTPQISDIPNSIALLEKIKLGGNEQWILVRGWNKANPVILFLHGGPGMPAMFLAHDFQRELEKHFVIVHWDRLGAGKSYEAGVKGKITVRQTLENTFELTRMLCSRFGKSKIYLVGHSWGSYLGMLAIKEHPEYYNAYIGMGQMAMSHERETQVQKDFLLRKSREAGDTTFARKIRLDSAEVNEDDLFRFGAELYKHTSFWPILFSGLYASEYTFTDVMSVKKGVNMLNRKMVYDVISGPPAENVKSADIPIYFFLGRYDYNTPSELAVEYFDSIKCPYKRLVWFENSAHFPFYEEPERFTKEMVKVKNETKFFD